MPRSPTPPVAPAFGFTPTAATRRLQAQPVAGGERPAAFRSQRHIVQAGGPAPPVAPPRGAAGGVTPPLGENAGLHGSEHLELADHTLPTGPPAHTTTAPAQGVRLKAQGGLHLEHLDGRVTGVRHAVAPARRTACASASPTPSTRPP